MACVARLEREKGAVAAVPGLDQHDAGGGDQFGASFGSHADEGIIESVQDQRGHGNVLGPVGTGNAMVVVVRASEAAVSRDNLLVKLPHSSNLLQTLGSVQARV